MVKDVSVIEIPADGARPSPADFGAKPTSAEASVLGCEGLKKSIAGAVSTTVLRSQGDIFRLLAPWRRQNSVFYIIVAEKPTGKILLTRKTFRVPCTCERATD